MPSLSATAPPSRIGHTDARAPSPRPAPAVAGGDARVFAVPADHAEDKAVRIAKAGPSATAEPATPQQDGGGRAALRPDAKARPVPDEAPSKGDAVPASIPSPTVPLTVSVAASGPATAADDDGEAAIEEPDGRPTDPATSPAAPVAALLPAPESTGQGIGAATIPGATPASTTPAITLSGGRPAKPSGPALDAASLPLPTPLGEAASDSDDRAADAAVTPGPPAASPPTKALFAPTVPATDGPPAAIATGPAAGDVSRQAGPGLALAPPRAEAAVRVEAKRIEAKSEAGAAAQDIPIATRRLPDPVIGRQNLATASAPGEEEGADAAVRAAPAAATPAIPGDLSPASADARITVGSAPALAIAATAATPTGAGEAGAAADRVQPSGAVAEADEKVHPGPAADTSAAPSRSDAQAGAAAQEIPPAAPGGEPRESALPAIFPAAPFREAHGSPLPAPVADLRTGASPNPAPPPIPLGAVPLEIGLRSLGGSSRFEIRLDPEDLGRIDVRLEIDAERQVRAHLAVERPETLAFLSRDQGRLERVLEQAGLKPADGGIAFSLRDGDAGQRGNSGDPGGGQTLRPLPSAAIDDARPLRPPAPATLPRSGGRRAGIDLTI